MKKLSYITVLRAIAILMVLMVHLGQQKSTGQYLHPYLQSFIQSGARGVQLFYIISAFTLCYSFKYRSQVDSKPLLNFYIRRFFRIAPLYYLAVVYYLWQDGFGSRYWLGDAHFITGANIASNFAFLHGLNPHWINSIVQGGWSVSIEVMFYALFPFIIRRVTNLNQAYLFILGAIIFKVCFILSIKNHPLIADGRLWGDYLFFSFPNQLPVFGLGIALYYLIIEDNKMKVTTISLMALFIIAYMDLMTDGTIVNLQLEKFGLAFLLLIVAIKSIQPSWLFNSAIYYIGDVSYTLYLVQFGVIYFLNSEHLFNVFIGQSALIAYINWIYNFLIGLAGSLFVATLFHFVIEIPAQNMGKKLIKKLA